MRIVDEKFKTGVCNTHTKYLAGRLMKLQNIDKEQAVRRVVASDTYKVLRENNDLYTKSSVAVWNKLHAELQGDTERWLRM